MPFSESPLDIWTAAKHGLLKEVQAFIAEGVAVGACGKGKVTALHEASEAGQLEVVAWLLKHGADPNARTIPNPGENGGYSALHLAVQNGHEEVAKLLLKHGAKINVKMSDGATPLMVAAEVGRMGLVDMLVSSGASLTLRGPMKHIPFTMALVSGHLEIARYLLEKGADVNHRTEPFNVTPIMWAALDKNLAHVEFLIKAGAEFNTQDDRGQTALHHAVIGGIACVTKTTCEEKREHVVENKPQDAIEIIKRLLTAGADFTIRDKDGMSPLDWAKKARAQDLVKLLEP